MAANQQGVNVNNILNQSTQLLSSFGSPAQGQTQNGQPALKFTKVPNGAFGEPAQSFSLNRAVRQPVSSQGTQQQQQSQAAPPPSSYQQQSSFQQSIPSQQPLPPQQQMPSQQQMPMQQYQQEQQPYQQASAQQQQPYQQASAQQQAPPQQQTAPPLAPSLQTFFNPSRFAPSTLSQNTASNPDYGQQQQQPRGVRFYSGQPTIDSPYNTSSQQTNLLQAIETPSNNEDNLKRLFSKSREPSSEESSKHAKVDVPKREASTDDNEDEEGGEWEEVSDQDEEDDDEPVLLASSEDENVEAEEEGDPVSSVREFDKDKPVVDSGDELQNLLRNATSTSRFAPSQTDAKTAAPPRYGLFNRDRGSINNFWGQQREPQNQVAQQQFDPTNNAGRFRDLRGRFTRQDEQQQEQQQQQTAPTQDDTNRRSAAMRTSFNSAPPTTDTAKPGNSGFVANTCNYFKGIDTSTGIVDTSARNKRIGLAIVALIVIIAGGGGLLYWLIKGRKRRQKSTDDDEQEEDVKPIIVEAAPTPQKQSGGLADIKKQERAKMEQQMAQATPSAPPQAIAAPPINPIIPATMDYDKLAEMSRNKAAIAMANNGNSNVPPTAVTPSMTDLMSQENMVL